LTDPSETLVCYSKMRASTPVLTATASSIFVLPQPPRLISSGHSIDIATRSANSARRAPSQTTIIYAARLATKRSVSFVLACDKRRGDATRVVSTNNDRTLFNVTTLLCLDKDQRSQRTARELRGAAAFASNGNDLIVDANLSKLLPDICSQSSLGQRPRRNSLDNGACGREKAKLERHMWGVGVCFASCLFIPYTILPRP